jgi:DNA-3-methyladenine glycosylase II
MNEKNHRRAKKHLKKVDPHLGKAIATVKIEMPKTARGVSPYERLARAIVGQQISTAAAKSIWAKFIKLFNSEKIDFVLLDRMPVEILRAAGLSPQKIGYMKDLAKKVSENGVPHPDKLKRMSDDEVVAALLPIKGVGEWTIHMLLIFHLLRPNVWPVRDLGVKKGFMKVHKKRKMPEEKWLEKFGEKFSPYRSYAALYYWRALDE